MSCCCGKGVVGVGLGEAGRTGEDWGGQCWLAGGSPEPKALPRGGAHPEVDATEPQDSQRLQGA